MDVKVHEMKSGSVACLWSTDKWVPPCDSKDNDLADDGMGSRG